MIDANIFARNIKNYHSLYDKLWIDEEHIKILLSLDDSTLCDLIINYLIVDNDLEYLIPDRVKKIMILM